MELTEKDLKLIRDSLPGCSAIYRINGMAVETLYVSPSLPPLNGMTMEEYMEVTKDTAGAIVHPEDVSRLMQAIDESIRTGRQIDCSFRVSHRLRGADWAHLSARMCGELDGCPVFTAVYNNASSDEAIYKRLLEDAAQAAARQRELENLVEIHEQQLQAAKILNGDSPLDDRMNSVIQLMQRYLQADRTYVITVDEGGATLTNVYESCREGVEPEIDFLQKVDIHLIDRWVKYFCRREVVAQEDVEDIRLSDPDEYAILKRQKISSYIEAPVIAGGEFIGFIGADNPAPDKMRHTSDLMLSLAFSVGNALVREKNSIQLRRHASEMETVVNNIPVGVRMIRIKNGRPVSKLANPLLCSLCGIAPEEAADADRIALLHMDKDDSVRVREKMHTLLVPGTYVRCEFRFYLQGRENPRWYQLSARSAAVDDELVVFSCLTDITAEREAEAENLKSRRMYEAAASIANLSVWTYDIPNRRIVFSDSMSTARDCEEYAIPKVLENVPESTEQWIDEADIQKVRELYRAIEEGAPSASAEYWYKKQPGTAARCERVIYTTVFDEGGRPVSAFGIGLDITAQVREREKYRLTIQTLLSSHPDAIGTFRLNLTKDALADGQSVSEELKKTVMSETADGFFRNVADTIADEDERRGYLERCSCEKLLADYVEGVSNFSLEYRRRADEYRCQWIRAYFSLLRNPDTGDVECVITAQDMTIQHRDAAIFERVTNQEFDYVALLHMHAGTIEFLKLNTRLSKRYHQALGKPGVQFNFDKIREFTASTWVDVEDRESYLKNSPVPVVREHLDRDGHFEMSLRGHPDGRPEEIICRKIQHYYLDDTDTVLIIQTDVTETYLQQQKESALLKAAAERVQDIMDSITDGIGVLHMTDPDHLQFNYVNQQMFLLLGFPEYGNDLDFDARINDITAHLHAKDAFSGLHPDDEARVRAAFRAGYYSERFVIEPFRTMGGDGKYHWLRQEVKLRETTPEYKVFYATFNDVEEEVRLRLEREQQLEKEKKLREQAMAASAAKTDFLSRMSHDIRTPLNGILGMTHIANNQDNPPKTSECLDKIDTSSKFLLGLVNDILDMSKAESGKIELHPEPYYIDDFKSYIDSVIRPLCDGKNQKLSFEVHELENVVPVLDILRMNQIYFNLLSNAVKYTPEGGSISVRVSQTLTDGGRDRLTVSVSDNGIGMSENFQKVLFESFTQENRDDSSEMRGSGLGLAIVKKNIEAMGGTIRVESTIGRGTRFTFVVDCGFVPVKAHTAGARTEAEDGSEERLRGLHVLLCEDHPMNQEIARAILQEAGIIVDVADNGLQGVEHFSNSGIGFYDAVLMDIRMPVMGGYEAAKRIRELKRLDAGTVPIIAMTADAFADDVKKCLDAGMNGHIAKPVDPDVLYLRLVEAVFGSK